MSLEILPPLDARIPAWPLDRLTGRKCPLCENQSQPLLLRPDHLPVAYCAACSLWYVCELPPESAIAELYEGYWRSFRPRDMSSAAAEQMVDCARQAHISDVRLQRLKALTGGLAGRRLLEVGCGLGGFLLAAREEGAEVIGNDVSAGACEFVRERLGIQSHERPLAELPGEIGPVDVVVMSDLIEHPVSPLEMLKTARALLKRGGLLLIWTPNGGAAGQTAKTARNWVGFRVDLEHLQYFSAKTITRLALRQGWDIEHLETLGYPDLEGIDRHPVHSNGAGARQLKSWLKNVPGSRRFAAGVREVVSSFKGRQQEARCGTYHLFTIIRRG